MYDEALLEVTVEAEAQLRTTLASHAPALSSSFESWLAEVFGGASLADAFTRHDAFPMLLIPWWIDGAVGDRDRQLHRLLTSSTMSSCLAIRLLDDVMDGNRPEDASLLPALGILHVELVAPYRRLFSARHPFWDDLRSIWAETAEDTFEGVGVEPIDPVAFERVSARNSGAVRIPIAAVCHYRGQDGIRSGWDGFAAAMGRWHLFQTDVLGWRKDLANGSATYFLSEGRRQRPDAVEAWVVEEGFAWAMAELAEMMRELRGIATELDANEALWYLEERYETVIAHAEAIRRDLGAVLGLSNAVSGTG